MKIGIVTYWKSHNNYGEQLQSFALQEYLKNMGHEPFLIRYDYEADTIYGTKPLPVRLLRACNPKRLAGYYKSKSVNKKRIQDGIAHPRGFESFREKHISQSRVFSSIDDLRNDPPEAELYITGSDQVWNTFGGKLSEMDHRYHAFFLDFGSDDTRRISYAASWGRESVPEDEGKLIKTLLPRIDAVSVRETTGIDLCCRLGRDDAFLALDPVLLLNAEAYRKLYHEDGAQKREGKYLLFYYLDNGVDFDRQKIFDWASKRGLEVVYVTDDWHENYERSFPDIPGWLKLIDDAEYVVTNSYHCSIFSLIFGKRFGFIKRTGSQTGMNSRMETLFGLCGIEPRFIDSESFETLELPACTLNPEKIEAAMRPEDVINKAFKR